jgi:hypothetical protein
LPSDFAALPLPEAYRAVTLHRDEEHMFDGLDPRDQDPRKSLHVEEVPVPELGLGEALIAVMASSVNYNTVRRAGGRGRGRGGLTAASGERDWHHRDRQRRCGYNFTYGLHGQPPQSRHGRAGGSALTTQP